jgi:hemophore-related protein
MADYLDSRPDVQQVFIDARSKGTPQERQAAIKAYTDTHPDVAATFQNIHQPVRDLSARCGLPMHQGMMPGGMAPGGLAPGEMAPGGMAPGEMVPGGMAPGQ